MKISVNFYPKYAYSFCVPILTNNQVMNIIVFVVDQESHILLNKPFGDMFLTSLNLYRKSLRECAYLLFSYFYDSAVPIANNYLVILQIMITIFALHRHQISIKEHWPFWCLPSLVTQIKTRSRNVSCLRASA